VKTSEGEGAMYALKDETREGEGRRSSRQRRSNSRNATDHNGNECIKQQQQQQQQQQ